MTDTRDKLQAERGLMWKLVFASSVATSLLTFVSQNVAGPFAQAWVSQVMSGRQSVQDRAEREITAFLVEARGFDPLSAAFVLAVSQDDRVSPEMRRNLVTSLVRQVQLLEVAARHLPADAGQDIKAYEDAVIALNGAIARIDGVRTMREFWERASDMVVARSALIQRLERGLG